MKELLDILRGINAELDKLDGRAVHRTVIDRSDTPRGDNAEQLAAALRRRRIVRER